MEEFKLNLKHSELKECPLCHTKIENSKDIGINFEKVSRKKRIEMFEIIYNSEEVLGWNCGFDKLDSETLIDWFRDLTLMKRKEIYDLFYETNVKNINKFLNKYWQSSRDFLWAETFKRLSKK